jgi:hypothetical protein
LLIKNVSRQLPLKTLGSEEEVLEHDMLQDAEQFCEQLIEQELAVISRLTGALVICSITSALSPAI